MDRQFCPGENPRRIPHPNTLYAHQRGQGDLEAETGFKPVGELGKNYACWKDLCPTTTDPADHSYC